MTDVADGLQSLLHRLEHRNNRVSVLLLCGFPGSGKSTLANTLVTQLSRKDGDGPYDAVEWICYDDLATELAKRRLQGDDNSRTPDMLQAWRDTQKEALVRLDALLEANANTRANANANRSRTLIILDDNFHLRSMRRQVFQTCQKRLALSVLSIELATAVEKIIVALFFKVSPAMLLVSMRLSLSLIVNR